MESNIWNMGISKTNDHIQIKIKMPKPSQEPPASFKASNEDLKDLDLFEPSKPRLRAKFWHMGVSTTGDHIKNKIKIPNPSQEHPGSSKALNQDIKKIYIREL